MPEMFENKAKFAANSELLARTSTQLSGISGMRSEFMIRSEIPWDFINYSYESLRPLRKKCHKGLPQGAFFGITDTESDEISLTTTSTRATPMSQHTAPQKTDLSRQHKAVLKMLGKAFARISHLFGYSAHAVSAAFKEGYLEYLLDKSPRAKVVELAIRSGLDRRQVSEYLKKRSVASWHKPTRFDLILSQLKWISENHAPNGRIPISGSEHSLEAACKQFATGCYTLPAVLNELIRRKNVTLYGEEIELNDWYFVPNEEENDFQKAAIWSVETLTKTLDKNKHTANPAQRNFQRMLYSSQIPEYRVEQLHGEVMQRLSGYYEELTQLLEKAESDVRPGTFPLYGIAFYEFGRDTLSGGLDTPAPQEKLDLDEG